MSAPQQPAGTTATAETTSDDALSPAPDAGSDAPAELPDPDLLIRTAGEMRVSNYLLWQISYAELFVSPVLWPDFGVDDLHQAVRAFSKRNRRFGALDRTNTLQR